MKQENVSIIIVSWNVKNDLVECLKSIQGCLDGLSPEVIVVDNASTDNSPAVVKKQFPWVRLVENKDNLGFAKANNQALEKALGDYLVFLNPDTKITNQTLQSLIAFIKSHTDAAFVGPILLNPDQSRQVSVRKFPVLLSQILILLKIHRLFPRIKPLESYFQLNFDFRFDQEVDQLMGACLMIKRSVLDKIGYFDESFFLWFEEVDIQKRAIGLGFKNYFTPKATIVHKKGESFQQRTPVAKQRIFNNSLIHYFKKHGAKRDVIIIKLFIPISIFLAAIVQLIESLHILPRKNKNL